jgi:hypothetical protein
MEFRRTSWDTQESLCGRYSVLRITHDGAWAYTAFRRGTGKESSYPVATFRSAEAAQQACRDDLAKQVAA